MGHRSVKQRSQHRNGVFVSKSTYRCEPLESRTLLSGSWQALTHTVPSGGGAQLMMLLTDGSVIIHAPGTGSPLWYKLSPNGNNYVTGNIATTGSMNTGRLFFGSAMQTDGNVFVVGGGIPGR